MAALLPFNMRPSHNLGMRTSGPRMGPPDMDPRGETGVLRPDPDTNGRRPRGSLQASPAISQLAAVDFGDVEQRLHILDEEAPADHLEDIAFAKAAHHAAYVNLCEAKRVGDRLLAQRKGH